MSCIRWWRGSAEGSLDAANILSGAFAREIQCIGATTPGEFRKSLRRIGRWSALPGGEVHANEADAIKIIHGIKDRYESFMR